MISALASCASAMRSLREWRKQLMKALHDVTVRVNSGTAWEMKKGQRVRITFQSIVDFVVFNRDNLQERFDQARTKANQGKIYLSTGDQLLSKVNNSMMTIVEDTFKGTHDLQYGMCSECSYTTRWNRRHLPPWNKLYPEAGITCREDLPLWGCYENIMTALQNYPIIPLDIPAPLNIGQHMELDEKGNLIWAVFAKHKELFDPVPHIDLRAEMNCLCAASCEPRQRQAGELQGLLSETDPHRGVREVMPRLPAPLMSAVAAGDIVSGTWST